jgi:hypothetical protein
MNDWEIIFVFFGALTFIIATTAFLADLHEKA